MLKYNILSIICIALLALIAAGYIGGIFRKKNEERVAYLRRFKKGSCAIIYVVIFPLFLMSYLHDGAVWYDAVFSSVKYAVRFIVLNFEFEKLEPLMGLGTYTVAVYLCAFLTVVNAVILAISLTFQLFYTWRNKLFWRCSLRKRLILVGNNKQNIEIYKSAKKYKRRILDKLDDKEKESLYSKKLKYLAPKEIEEPLADAVSRAVREAERIVKRNARKKNAPKNNQKDNKKNKAQDRKKSKLITWLDEHGVTKDRRSVIVINMGDDERNTALCRSVIDSLKEAVAKDEKNWTNEKKAALFSRLSVYVFGDPRYETVYTELVDEANGCLHYVNKYRRVAMDFVDKYPLTQFMNKDHIDFDKSVIRKGVEINVLFIGFGRTNMQIFLTSVANNQFLTETEGGVKLLPVNYHIYDKQRAESNKNLNHTYNRFKNELLYANEADYLPLPDEPAKKIFHRLDVNDPFFYRSIKKCITEKGSVNYLVIGFGTDLENIDMAQKLIEKKQEWGVDALTVFVKVRSGNASSQIFSRKDCYLIGDEKACVYNIDKLCSDKMNKMAIQRNQIYAVESAVRYASKKNEALGDVNEIISDADHRWYIDMTQIERDSNEYGVLSLRSKLQLMGMDYCTVSEAVGKKVISADEYEKRYAIGDDIKPRPETANGKRIVDYTLDFPPSRRKTMAIHEHYRWNSYMISCGMVPATKEQIKEEAKTDKYGNIQKDGEIEKKGNGKNYKYRHHGNITTFEGLVEFRKMITERDGNSEADNDVIQYDYQLLDDAAWLLESNEFKIIEKEYK